MKEHLLKSVVEDVAKGSREVLQREVCHSRESRALRFRSIRVHLDGSHDRVGLRQGQKSCEVDS